ncbi:CDP-glycerol glycerophosphotransferase family protein [Brevibacterium atlanticum]|uniref:CDP-glycerol glycerophosphotransferase family protein n=1 Tax=Brevibacterium atlanticum TaxID=2697563 RepID=UPI00141D8233|nr:CDP-glycerol glycerophosphotransferase family protein [Brevibacterium atlanticum]
MIDIEPLLTVVFEAPEDLDKESTTYRRLIAARLHWDSKFELRIVDHLISTSDVVDICGTISSDYVVFMRHNHQISADYLQTLLKHLNSRTVFLAEPHLFTGAIPKNPSSTRVNSDYHYLRDTDIYGVAFNTQRLADALEAIGDLDRTGLYLGYRLYWTINNVKPLPTGYSIASDTKAAIGIQLDPRSKRLVPLLPNTSLQLRVKALRYLVLFLRGIRESEQTAVTIPHLRDVVSIYRLNEITSYSEHMHSFECAWISWLAAPEDNEQLFKELSTEDSYITFGPPDRVEPGDTVLHKIQFSDRVLAVSKAYRSRTIRPELNEPGYFDFYQTPITPQSKILFFDRPMQADDNAEYLYAHFVEHYPEFENVYFALNPKSPDWNRLTALGFNLIPFFSTEFYETFLRCDLVVASQIYNLRYKGKTLSNSRFVYLQHGVQINDMSTWVESKLYDIFVATGQVEADYLKKVAPKETLNSGLPRLQTLDRAAENSNDLLFMPTWRFNLHQVSPESFRKSNFYRAVNAVLTDRDLNDYLESTDRRLLLKLHPNIGKRANLFSFSSRVVESKESYRTAISAAEFVFTDYSSAVLDAAYIDTPIAYYQWDSEEFFLEQPYEARLDYRNDGLGPVFTSHSDVVDYIVSGSYRDAAALYSERKRHFFEGVQTERINDTIIERMLKL